MKKLLALIFVSLAVADVQAKEPKPQKLLFWPRMEYPVEARRQHMEGAGVYVLDVNKRGLVTAVHVAISSGHALLDQAAIDAFRKCRFKTPCAPRVKIPAHWSLSVR